MNNLVLKKTYEAVDSGKKAALVVLMVTEGSTPGKQGSLMVVIEGGEVFGTIGGGKIEFEIIKRVEDALVNCENFEFDYSLVESSELGMACGGSVRGYVQIFYPNKKLVLFGGGHVSQKIAEAAKNLSFNIYVVDDREEFRNAFKNVEYICCPPDQAVKHISFDKNTYVVIATRGHLLDSEALCTTVRLDTAYVGMIGSRKKVAEVKNKLKSEGIDEQLLNAIYAPIGLDISDGTPEEIAFSVIGEILMVKNSRALKHMKV